MSPEFLNENSWSHNHPRREHPDLLTLYLYILEEVFQKFGADRFYDQRALRSVDYFMKIFLTYL